MVKTFSELSEDENKEVDKKKHYLCYNCEEEVYFGKASKPVGKYAELDPTWWNTEEWRHTGTQLPTCLCKAEPSNMEVRRLSDVK